MEVSVTSQSMPPQWLRPTKLTTALMEPKLRFIIDAVAYPRMYDELCVHK